MKKLLLLFVIFSLVVTISSCEKTVEKVVNCTNGIKDNDEKEIDCGGSCDPCPDPATLTCNINSYSFEGVSSQTYAGRLGPSLRVYSYSYSSGYLKFMFIPHDVNVPTQLSTGDFIYNGESYVMGQNAQQVYDTGTVVITSIDTLRHIMSGTFGFSARRTTGSSSARATGGVFTNVRYH